MLTFFFAFLIGGNMLAPALGTAVGNPLMFPFIWTSTYRLGHILLGHDPALQAHHPLKLNLLSQSRDAIWPIFKPMLIGSLPLGLTAGAIAYFIIYGMITRREKLCARRTATQGAQPQAIDRN
ncbi:DUF2062 domain-containing protein [Breoghania sp.]|uniref:DUF2062 domain-containing protein n=1 Tax=Breoghania sp. TaxID=2065378 RepID=UPI002602B8EE|nr:DUF2062 domain-containing protein [Breoghania sp.]MDJ0932268.1 DUF2062 domain-containing protein [Breoghania sp.]